MLRAAGALVDEREWGVSPNSRSIRSRLLHRLRARSGVRKPWKKIKQFKPDLVCISQGGTTGGLVWMDKCIQDGLAFVAIVQGVHEANWPNDDLAERLIAAYCGARAAFFVSKRNVQLFETQLGISLPNASIVQNPFQVPWDVDVSWPAEDPNWQLASVGRLEPVIKSQDLLFNALARQRWRERNWHLNLYGSGNGERSLRRLSKNLQLEGRITFHGHVPDVAGIWADNHILLLPSRWEGLPLALVEAMLCARTAVVSDVAGNVEIVEDNSTGFVAAAPTVDFVDSALERAWQRRLEWKTIGLAAAKAIRQIRSKDPDQDFADLLKKIATSQDLSSNGHPHQRQTLPAQAVINYERTR
jgi:glycosyltransferase involved in cell wall biosynthesis